MSHNPIERDSSIERDVRRRAIALLDPGIFRRLLDPFEQLTSSWLSRQDIVTQADDGVVMARDMLGRHPVAVLTIEDAFRGGNMDEISGARIAGALELVVEDNRSGTPACTVTAFGAGGVWLQEVNPGLTAIAEIHAGIRALRGYGPVTGIAVSTIGCFGGMSTATGPCSYLLMTRETCLDLNGPQVIEQEASTEEYDLRDHPFVWSLTGGEQRIITGLADVYIEDGSVAIHAQMVEWLRAGTPMRQRSERIDHYLAQLVVVDALRQATAEDVYAYYVKDIA